MAPNLLGSTTTALYSAEPVQIISKPDVQHEYAQLPKQARNQPKASQVPKYKWDIAWRNVFAFIYLHTFALYGIYLMFTTATLKTSLWNLFLLICAGQGITAGAHRLWAHKTYKAKLPLRIILGVFQTLAFQNHIYEWVRDHRVHHKFTDSDADPHNASRGFFFSHIGWLMLKKHRDVKEKGKTIDMTDLLDDPVVTFQMKYYLILMPIMCFIMPTLVPWYYWNENLYISWYVCIARYTISLNGTWSVNSAAHIWGNKPYDKSIKPTENKYVSMVAFGEGWHNYHHIFPWDYKAAELGNYRLNLTTGFLDLMARIGWAYDLKTASVEMVKKRMKRTGDGTISVEESVLLDDNGNHQHHDHGDHIWGWGDKDMKQEDIVDIKMYNQLKED